MTNFKKKLETFFEEKDLPVENFEVKDKNWELHMWNTEVVIESILGCWEKEQAEIYDMLVKLDFKNADINDYLKHLFQWLANNR